MFDNEVSYSNSYKGFSFRESCTNSGSLNYCGGLGDTRAAGSFHNTQPSSSPFTVLTSDKEVHTFSTSGIGYEHLEATGTGSFVSISQDIGQYYTSIAECNTLTNALPRTNTTSDSGSGREDGDYTGELLPVGDMLLPMLALACAYILTKIFRNRKISKAL